MGHNALIYLSGYGRFERMLYASFIRFYVSWMQGRYTASHTYARMHTAHSTIVYTYISFLSAEGNAYAEHKDIFFLLRTYIHVCMHVRECSSQTKAPLNA